MSESWQDKLSEKAKELNLNEEEVKSNVSIRTVSRSSDRSSDRGVGGSVRLSANKEIKIIEKGGNIMIGIEGALSDVDDVVSKGIYKDRETKKEITLNTDLEKIGAIVKILLKFLSTIRSNQLLTEQDKVDIKKKKAERPPKTGL